MKKEKENKSKPIPYIPDDTKLNFDNIPMDDPKTEYEENRAEFDRDSVLKITIK